MEEILLVSNILSIGTFVFLFVCFCGHLLLKELGIPIGILPMSGAGVNGNAPYQAQELQITTLANPGIQKNFLPPRPLKFYYHINSCNARN